MRLPGKCTLLTGASGGIGRALALVLAQAFDWPSRLGGAQRWVNAIERGKTTLVYRRSSECSATCPRSLGWVRAC